MHSMPLLVYTLIAVIILRYSSHTDTGDSTGTVIYVLTTSGLGPKLYSYKTLVHGSMHKRHARAS